MNSSSAALDSLTDCLSRLETSPSDVPLLRKQIALLRQLRMAAELRDCISRLSSLVMLNEELWLEYLDGTIESSSKPLSLESFVTILELFERAENDYLSLAILLRHLHFVIHCTSSDSAIDDMHFEVDPEVHTFLDTETARNMLRGVLHRGGILLTESGRLWDPWINWEMRLLKEPGQIDRLHGIFLERLATPHSGMDATSSAYSSFLSAHCPDEYEKRMVEATAASQSAKFKWASEKRFGKTREDLEHLLTLANPLQTYHTYIEWEVDSRAKHPRHARAPSADPVLIRGIFERAVAAYARASTTSQADLYIAPLPVHGEENSQAAAAQSLRWYKAAEAKTWLQYCLWCPSSEERLLVAGRAVRACPQVGSSWSNFCQQKELAKDADVLDTLETANSLGLLDQPADLAEVVLCRAAFINRNVDGAQDVLVIIAHGFESISKVHGFGDASLRLEKFLLDWAETREPEVLDKALTLLDQPLKSRSSSYQYVILRAGVESRRGNAAGARAIYHTAMQRSDLDWPEAVYEALVQLEGVHGTIETVSDSRYRIDAEQNKVARRRQKAAQEQFQQYYADAQMGEIAEVAISDPTATGTSDKTTASAMSEVPLPTAVLDKPQGRRDRENTTVLVTGLSAETSSDQIDSFFANCGHIRETTMIRNNGTCAALVEFNFADAVPRGLERDRKKLEGRDVHVSMLWRSTLFVTNFPRDMDDQGLRKIFSQYGSILQTRWPSRKFADSRRFCYVTMGSPAMAREALLLHGVQMEGFGLTVLISDPSAKTKRTDAEVSDSTLFIGGLSAKTTEQDIEGLLSPFGSLRHVKLGWDPVKRVCKGFAFVEMASETEAQACLQLHGKPRDGRFLKVEISDPHHQNKKTEGSSAGVRQAADRRARTVRLHDLPENTQEGLLQQALEKLVPVKRLEIFARSHEAICELESQADAGLLLLRPEAFVFENTIITFTEQGKRPRREGPTRSQDAHPSDEKGSVPASSLSFAPRNARPGKAIAKSRQVTKQERPMNSAGQDFFRTVVQLTNEKRADKRRMEDDTDEAEKRPRTE